MKDWFNRMGDKAASWRLPVVIPVPNRDNLIAMGLMALAFGLLVGFAIGPLLAPAGNAVAAVVVSRWEGRLDRAQFDAALAGLLPPVERLPEGEVEP